MLRSQTQLAQHLQEQARTPLALNANKYRSTIRYVDSLSSPPAVSSSPRQHTRLQAKSFPAAQHPQAQTPGTFQAFLQLFLLQSHDFVQCKNKRQKKLQHQLPTWVLAPSTPGSQQQMMMMMVVGQDVN